MIDFHFVCARTPVFPKGYRCYVFIQLLLNLKQDRLGPPRIHNYSFKYLMLVEYCSSRIRKAQQHYGYFKNLIVLLQKTIENQCSL